MAAFANFGRFAAQSFYGPTHPVTRSAIARRALSSAPMAIPSSMTHLIFGANTDVGKTVITAGLVRACKEISNGAHYIKPLQCGGSDQSFVIRHAPKATVSSATLFEWESPTSPHAASRVENDPVSDEDVNAALRSCLNSFGDDVEGRPIWVETAGGVLSPSSSSPQNNLPQHAKNEAGWGWLTQGDLYRDFRREMDVLLIGDGRLGGISATLSSLESLLTRGYNVTGIVLIEKGYSNQEAIREFASRSCPIPFASKSLLFDNPNTSIISLPELPPEPEPLMQWYESADVSQVLDSFVREHLAMTWQKTHS